MRVVCVAVFAMLVGLWSMAAMAQDEGGSVAETSAVEEVVPVAMDGTPITPELIAPVAAAAPRASVVVLDAWSEAVTFTESDRKECRAKHRGDGLCPDQAARLGDMLTLDVQGLGQAIEDAGGECESLVLFLAGLPMRGIHPSRCDPDNGHVGFLLARTEEGNDAWKELLGHPTAFRKVVQATIGSSETRSYPRKNGSVPLMLTQIPAKPFMAFLVIALGTLAIVGFLGRTTALLRDPSGSADREERLRPYSLSRVQQAFWFVLSVLAYLFVWLMTGELDSLSTSVLALISISSGTALASEALGSSHTTRLISKEKKLREQALRLYASRARLDGADHSDDERRTADDAVRLNEEALTALQAAIRKGETEGFFTDLVRDPAGVSLQRAQIAVWTVVLGVIFVYEVYARLTMPEFSATLLSLMGISSGTYLAGKTVSGAGTESAAG